MVPNAEVLRQANIVSIDAMLMLNHLRWLGHVHRMDDNRIPKQLLYGQLKSGKRNPGRQKLRYQDVIRVSLARCNAPLRSWEDVALTRTDWRSMISTGV